MTFLDEIISQSKSVNNYKPRSSYVYYGVVDGRVAYVGKGTRDRYRHLINGKSRIKNVVDAYDCGSRFQVFILCDWLSVEEALALEKSAIRGLQPYLNLEMYTVNSDTKKGWPASVDSSEHSSDTAPA